MPPLTGKLPAPEEMPVQASGMNPITVFALISHQVTFSCSPLSTKLVKLTQARLKVTSCQEHLGRALAFNEIVDTTLEESDKTEDDDENWLRFIVQPRKLAHLIKQYHCVGSEFFVVVFVQITVICYLFAKAIFHKVMTGSDERLASYYADRYFPRLYHSYQNSQNLDLFTANTLFYILVFRFMRLYSLVKNSIINRNGYKSILMPQLNMSSVAGFRVPNRLLHDFVRLVYGHGKECKQSRETRERHLRFDSDVETIMMRKSWLEFVYFMNPINFTECYSTFRRYITTEGKSHWAMNWFVAEPVARLDLTEFSWLVSAFILGIPLGCVIVTSLVILATTHELCTVARDNGQDECLTQIPLLLFDISRLVRLLDIIALILIQVPQQVEGALFYWDCCALISRTRKVDEALQNDLEFCRSTTRTNELSTMIFVTGNSCQVFKSKQPVNRSISLHVQLIKCIHYEFRDLRKAHTVFLNILLVGCGLLISISISELFLSDTLFKKLIIVSFIISCSIPIFLSVFFCILTEHTVSTKHELK